MSVLVLASAMAFPGQAMAQTASPDAGSSPPVDLTLVMPSSLGGTDLTVEVYGSDQVRERMDASDDVLLATLREMLASTPGTAVEISAVMASPADPLAAAQYELTALHVAGMDARAVLGGLFRELLEDQLEASGIDDPEEVEELTSDLEAMIPWQTIDGREIASPQVGEDSTFEFIYPFGQILFLVKGDGGLSLAEVLAALP